MTAMDSRLKERLIGAAVLVALGVWLIPWLLDGSARQTESATPALELPADQDAAPVRTQTIHLAQSTKVAEQPTAVGAPSGGGGDSAASRVAAQSGRVTDSAADAASSSSGPWVVQLGSFGDSANAERLASRVSAYGYEAAVSDVKAAGKALHRVRLGPYATRGEAEAVTSSLSVHGFVAQVVQDQ
jgi:DedD protein